MDKKPSHVRTVVAYIVLIFLTFLCLFFFYILVVNATRNHTQIQKGFSFIPGKSFIPNLKHVLNDANIPVLSGIKNSLIVSSLSAVLATYFSALTAYGLYAYNFKLKKPAFIFIMLILVMPTQVSAMGFINLITKMGMLNTLFPLFLPSIAAPAVFMKPALAVQAIFAFVQSWNNYFIPALVISDNTKKTLPILIAALRSADFLKFDMGKVYMLITIAIVPIIIVYIALSKYIVAGVALGGVKE